jgi:hypothetical protein
MQTVIEAMQTLEIKFADPELESVGAKYTDLDTDATLTEEMSYEIEKMWKDEGLQSCYARRNEYWILDAAPYYFDNVIRLGEDDYVPNDEDMIMTRVRTTGIVITEFEEKPQKYQLVDVGGQRSERRKWIHCFDDVKAIIFLEGLSSFNQVLFEDSTVNRMHESLSLFGEVSEAGGEERFVWGRSEVGERSEAREDFHTLPHNAPQVQCTIYLTSSVVASPPPAALALPSHYDRWSRTPFSRKPLSSCSLIRRISLRT